MIPENEIAPAVLSGSVDLIPNSLRVPIAPDSLINRLGVPFWADGIRFTYSLGAAGINFADIAPSLLRAQIFVGRHELTRGPIPLRILCKVIDRLNEGSRTTTANGLTIWLRQGSGSVGSIIGGSMTWVFPRPLYIPNGQAININMSYDFQSILNASGITPSSYAGVGVEAAIYGRPVNANFKPPALVPVPYATAWIDSFRANSTSDRTVNSSPSDLINPFSTPFYVKEFLGNINTLIGAVNGTAIFDAATYLPQIGYDYASAQMIGSGPSSHGAGGSHLVVRDFTPWNFLFSILDRAWSVNTVLSPHAFFQLRTKMLLSKYAADPSMGNPSTTQFMASMLGYRMVASKDLVI